MEEVAETSNGRNRNELTGRSDSSATESDFGATPPELSEEARLKRAELLVSEAEKRRLTEEDELRRAELELRRATEQLEQRRSVVEEARRKAEADAQSLNALEDQIRAEEESRRQIEIELKKLKLEAQTLLEEQRLRFEEARSSVVEEQQRVAAELSKLFSEEHERLSSLKLEKQRAEDQLQQQAELERRLKAEIEELYLAGAEQRRRIEVETQRRAEVESRLRAEHTHVEIVQTPVIDVARTMVEPEFSENESQFSGVPSQLIERLKSSSAEERSQALFGASELGGEGAFRLITQAFEDSEPAVRGAAARALHNLGGDCIAIFTRALKESDANRRHAIGAAIASSGLAQESIAKLTAESREETYNAFSLLFLMARAGELQPLIDAVKDSSDVDIQLAAVKLLNLTRQSEIVPALEALKIDQSLSTEVKSALTATIADLTGQPERTVAY